jgi:crotonobetainyl-CoA:carnitine CoA-transferase CaiB-like acyl-CoA transferase
VAANTKAQFTTLCRLLGRTELAQPPFVPAELASEAFLANLATEELRAALSEAFSLAKADELEVALNAAGVPAARVRDLSEYLDELNPKRPGMGIAGEPVALAPPFRWERDHPLNLPPARTSEPARPCSWTEGTDRIGCPQLSYRQFRRTRKFTSKTGTNRRCF